MTGSGRHVLFVYDGLPPYRKGGAETRLGAIAAGLAVRGWRVSWIGLAPPGAPEAHCVDGICYHKIGPEPVTRGGRRRGLLPLLRYCVRLWRCSLPDDVDCVVLGQIPWVHFFIIRWRLRTGTPILVDCWEIWGTYWRTCYGPLLGHFGRLLERAVVRKASLLASLSGQTRRGLISHGVDERFIVNAPNGVDHRLVDRIHVERNDQEIAYFGRLVPHKNVDLLIAAFADVAAANPEASLVIIGDGGERFRLEALTETLGVSARVRFLGAMPDHAVALARLKSASVCVQPSTSEGGGSVAVHEANACGLPVIAFRSLNGIDPDLISEGLNGFWLDELDKVALAQLLTALLRDRPRLARLRRTSREATAHLDWSRTVDAVDKALGGLVEAGRRAPVTPAHAPSLPQPPVTV